jgi:NAD(P)-dependent dehydrogenase (short-subunit alcohol dehydrogenase family)
MHVWDLLSLKDKVILVTGGAGKYGRSITEGLAEAGAQVIIASRNIDSIQEVTAYFQASGYSVTGMQLDQSDSESVSNLKNQIVQKFGKLDAFVNNAVARPMKGYRDSIKHFADSMDINATGMMNLLREMTDLIQKGEGGSVVSISSMMGMFAPDYSNYLGVPGMGDVPPDYCFHNAGLIMLMKYMAKTHAGSNIRFNCISPGSLESPELPPTFLQNYIQKVPMRRQAHKDDIKGLVVLLCSEAGAYINGANILMDGGLNA